MVAKDELSTQMSRRIPFEGMEKVRERWQLERNIATNGIFWPRLLRKQLERSKVARNFARFLCRRVSIVPPRVLKSVILNEIGVEITW